LYFNPSKAKASHIIDNHVDTGGSKSLLWGGILPVDRSCLKAYCAPKEATEFVVLVVVVVVVVTGGFL
jgi:hypothetical protein